MCAWTTEGDGFEPLVPPQRNSVRARHWFPRTAPPARSGTDPERRRALDAIAALGAAVPAAASGAPAEVDAWWADAGSGSPREWVFVQKCLPERKRSYLTEKGLFSRKAVKGDVNFDKNILWEIPLKSRRKRSLGVISHEQVTPRLLPTAAEEPCNRSLAMNLNSDFGARAAVHAAQLDWTPSPIPGVDRRMLDRIGDEVARATSIVRYTPHSRFSSHTHGGGEEFLVLDGVFQDEHGDYHPLTYVRNPPTSSHTPCSEQGCTIFVKLWQFDPEDRTPVRIDTSTLSFAPAPDAPGVDFAVLYESASELVLLGRWAPGISIAVPIPGGIELFVLDGSLIEGGEELTRLSWLRLPAGATLQATAGRSGCKVWVKSGHLARDPRMPGAP